MSEAGRHINRAAYKAALEKFDAALWRFPSVKRRPAGCQPRTSGMPHTSSRRCAERQRR